MHEITSRTLSAGVAERLGGSEVTERNGAPLSSTVVEELTEQLGANLSAAAHAERALCDGESRFREMIDALPAAIYTTDANGKITHFNPACTAFSGRTPTLGSDHWCVTWKLFYPDGRPMPHDKCPMAVALKGGRAVRGAEAIAERPDGTRIWFAPYPTPFFDDEGNVVGGINMLVDITERKAREAERAAESAAFAKLNQLSSRLWQMRDLREGLDEMLSATIELLSADFGTIQMMDPAKGALVMVAQRGFNQDFVDFFREVAADDDSACGRALRIGDRIVVEDIETDECYAPMRPIARSAGYRAVQSTPILGRDGKAQGMISTHFRAAHRPSEHELRLLDLYARHAGDFIERCNADEALRRNEAELEAELADTKLLQRISAAMTHQESPEVLYQQIMDAAVAIMRSEYASMQMLYPRRGQGGELRLLAFRGFNPQAARFWEWVRADSESTCGQALRTRERAIAADVEQCEYMAGSDDLATYLQTGIRAVQTTPLFSRSGELIGMISTHWKQPHQSSERDLRLLDILARQAADLIERQKAEDALRESEERFRMVADNMPALAWTCDKLGNVTWYNKRWLDYTGLTFEEMKDWGWTRCPHPDHVDRVVESITRSRESGEPWEDTFPLRGKDGQYRWFLSRAVPIRDEAGQIVRWFGTNTDVTERVELEQQTREQAAELSDLHRRKDEFMAMLSHELRNPIAPIVNALQLFRLHKEPNAIQEQSRTIIERQVGQLVRLVDDLLEVSRISTGRIHLHEERLDLRGIVERATETVRPLVTQRRHALSTSQPEEPVWVVGDAGRLEQVVVNLLTNAAKYTDEAGDIWLSVELARDEAVVRVRDTGVGISAELLPRVFDLFTQADRSLARSQGGLGVGLALVRQIVELHGGRVEATSVVGQGSEFIVRLPLSRSADQFFQPSAACIAPPGGRSCRVLVVDDNIDTAYSVSMLLRNDGHDVRVANNGPDAIAAALEFQPEIALVDIGLPEMTGHEVAQRLRAELRLHRTTLVAVTGYGQESDRQQSREAGFDFHLVKPMDLTAVRQIMATVANKEKDASCV